jgi:hypothetical protein
MQHLIRVEAVNLKNFLEDTEDLSTIRGGGLLLLNAPEALSELEKVYVGASSGLFLVDLGAGQDPASFCEALRRRLQTGKCSEATFVVDATPYDGTAFPTAHALATAANRWNQMRSPTVVLPSPEAGPCQVDRLRPATTRMVRKEAAFIDSESDEDRTMLVSAAVKARRDYGVEEKFHFYERHCHGLPDTEFTNDLNQLTDYPEGGKLHHKMAVIYLDGNGYGKILSACRNPGKLSEWSDLVHRNQDQLLAWLLSEVRNAKRGKTDWFWSGSVVDTAGRKRFKSDAVRLETLLWGGDEILWVVPAWKGWWMLRQFFERYGRFGERASREFDPGDGRLRPLTTSAAIVLCHHNAPIHRVIRLAKNLTERPKEIIQATGESRDYCTYQVLESFDHLGGNPNEWRNKLVARLGVDESGLILRGDEIRQVERTISSLKEGGLARSRLHDVLAAIYRKPGRDFSRNDLIGGLSLGKVALDRAGMTGAFQELVAVSASAAPTASSEAREAIAWLHVGELWDYIVEPDSTGG